MSRLIYAMLILFDIEISYGNQATVCETENVVSHKTVWDFKLLSFEHEIAIA